MEMDKAFWLLLALILPASALLARGLPTDRVLKLIVIWTLVIGALAVIVWLAQANGWISG